MRCEPSKIVKLGSWFLFKLTKQSLGVFYSLKIGLDRNIDHYKACLLATRYMQINEQNYSDILYCKNGIYLPSLFRDS